MNGNWSCRPTPARGDPCLFDYNTISDVILHIRYTAREGGEPLRRAALENLKDLIREARAAASVRLFSVRHEFPAEWARFQAQAPDDERRAEVALTLRPEHYPFWSQGWLDRVERVELLARSELDSIEVFQAAERSDSTGIASLTRDAALGGLLKGSLTAGLSATPYGPLRLSLRPPP